jgi:hypothetical protein
MTFFSTRAPILATCLLLALIFCSHASAKEPDYTGHYELADPKASHVFSLDIKQKDDRATISFSASMADGSGAAPDAEGKGEVEDGVLSFKFKDSFDNEGTATLEYKKSVYHLVMAVTKVVDTGALHFYGTMIMKQTKSK